MRYVVNSFLRVRYAIRPDIRQALDGFGMVIAITLPFYLGAELYNTIHHRNTAFDQQRWWYPAYKMIRSDPRFCGTGETALLIR